MIKQAILATGLLLTGAATAHAQEVRPQISPEVVERSEKQEACAVCFRGQSKNRCSSFLITESYLLMPLSGSNVVNHDISWILGLEVGWMKNLSRHTAVGASGFSLGGPARAGLKLRYRHWLSQRFAVDADVGKVLWNDSDGHKDWYIGSIGLNCSDRLLFTLQYETKRGPYWEQGFRSYNKSRRVSEVYAGLKLGSEPGIALTSVEVIALVLIAATYDWGN